MDDLGYDAPIWVKNKDIKFLFMNDISTHFSFDSTVSQGYPPRSEDECGLYIHLPGTEHDEQENSL
jgi:hypothetical protein